MGLRGRCGKDHKFRYLLLHYVLVDRYLDYFLYRKELFLSRNKNVFTRIKICLENYLDLLNSNT